MSYSSYLKPRPEVISEQGIEGIIDLANLKEPSTGKLETRPKDFLDLTYPTSDLKKVLEQINLRFNTNKEVAGVFLFEGLKGSGKSHLLLTIYNLFKYPDIGQAWLKKNKLKFEIPRDSVIIINKFTDDPYGSIWNLIFEKLGAQPFKGVTHPEFKEFKKALGERSIILIFDELEQGIKVISDPALQAQNIAFLQMLSEYSNRSKQVTLFAAIYSDQQEPGSTLKRGPRCVVQFDNAKDQSNIVLHRLFENYMDFERSRVSPIIESYLQLWKKHVSLEVEELKKRFQDTYPFSPSLIDIILKKIPARGGFQNVRGALAFLGNVVRLTYKFRDIITTADASLKDKENTIMLKDLDPSGDLINRAKENMEDLESRVPLAEPLACSVLLYTLTSKGSDVGVSRDQLIIEILRPGVDINDFEKTLMGFQKYASYFHHQEGRYYFDLEENSEAKVEFRSLKYSDDEAREKLYELFKTEVFKESENTVVFVTIDQVQEALKQCDKTRPRFVLTGRRLTKEERHKIYYGMDFRNLILVLEPKDDKFQLQNDPDLLKWAKRYIAAKELAGSTKKSSRKDDYERIASADQRNIVERIRKAGLVFVNWEKYGTSVEEDISVLEPLPGDLSKDKVFERLTQDYFPSLRFKEHMEGRIEEIKERFVKEVDTEYRSTLGFPIPLTISLFYKAIRDLCKEGTIGIQHSSGNFCHQNPNLTETELSNSKIVSPFIVEVPKKICPKCGKTLPCECDKAKQPCPVCGEYPCICDIDKKVCPICGQRPCVCPKKETLQLKIPPQMSIGNLRQETAFRLQQNEGCTVTKVTYSIFFQKKDIGDLSSMPSALRGSLSGPGDLTAEISITKQGSFSKSQVESQIESLPNIPGAEYSAELSIEVSK
uniref:DUF499 domain-containing protein n=1 Tax=candidate division WOR-3 bacterium TaxID=2052148 RepID=A0A7V3NUQ1_UNCW3